jgi:hypothetical protein
METKQALTIGNQQYEIRMWTVTIEDKGIWYELWLDGNIVGKRNPWPINIDTQQPLSKRVLVEEVTKMLIEYQGRTRGAGG